MKVCRVAKDIKEVKFGYIRGDLGSGGVVMFPETVARRVSGSIWGWLWFSCGVAHRIFQKIFRLVLTKLSFWWEDWVLDCHSINFSQFPDFSLFPKIPSLKSFGNSYIPCL